MRALAALLAVLAAGGNATASVLERRVNREQPDQAAMRWELVARLVRQPLWLAGLGATTASFLLQAAALGFGQLSMVQPILILELPMTLVIAARAFGNDLGRREWSAVAAMTAGLGALTVAAAPSGGSPVGLDALDWILGLGAAVGAVGVLVGAGVRAAAGARATAYALAAGIGFGVTAALMKAMDHALSDGVVDALAAWQTWAMVVFGAFSMFLVQNAFQAGRLVAAQPAVTLSDPLVAMIWGAALYHEHIRTGVWLGPEVAGALAIGWGAFRLAGSPAASRREDRDQEDPKVLAA
ncbi:MAG TPA: DMT family transporter [Acidimicrobiales bacterium]|nr:DMT family transporter [Acidimicrobiales bacterium]